MCSKFSTDVLQPGPFKPDDNKFSPYLKDAFGYDFEDDDIPLFFEISEQLEGLFVKTIRNGTNVNGFISFLSSCVRMSADNCSLKRVYETSFDYLWQFAKLRFSSMFSDNRNKNFQTLTDVQHQCIFVWTELFKLADSKLLRKLPPTDNIQMSTLERVIIQCFLTILLHVWSIANRVVPCTCVASAWNVYLSRTSKPIEELNNIYKAIKESGVRPSPTVTLPEIGDWGTVQPTFEVKVPYHAKLPVVMLFDDAMTMTMVRLSPETVLATMFALYPHVCTAFIQIDAFSKNLATRIKTFSYGLYRTLIEFIDRVPEIIPSLFPYLKTITKKMSAEECIDDCFKKAIGTPDSSENDFICYVNLLVKCVTTKVVEPAKLDKLVADIGSFWAFDISSKNPTRYCLLLSALSASTKFPSVRNQVISLGEATTSTSCIWMIFLTLPKIDSSEWHKSIELLKKLSANISDEERSDFLDALEDVLSNSHDRQILSLFPYQWTMSLPSPLARKFFNIIRVLPDEVKNYSKALLTPLILSTNNVDVKTLSNIAAIQLSLSKLDFWKQLVESRLDASIIVNFVLGICELVSFVSRDNYGIICSMAMFLGVVKAGNQKVNAAIIRVLPLLGYNKKLETIMDMLLDFVRSSSDSVIDAVYDLAILQRIAVTIRTMPNEERLEPLKSCVKILCKTDYSRWIKRKTSPNDCPNIRLINNVIKPFLVQQDFGSTKASRSAQMAMLFEIRRIKLPDQQTTMPFFKNFFAGVDKAIEKFQC